MLSPRKKSRRRFTQKEKGKKKMPKYNTSTKGMDQNKSYPGKKEGGSSERNSESAKKGLKPGNKKLRRSTGARPG